MTSVIAPPPEVVATLADLMAAIKHVTPKTVADLQAAALGYRQAMSDLALANSSAVAMEKKLEKLESAIDAKQTKLDAQKLEQDAKALLLATSEGNLQGAYTNLESRTQEFDVYAKAKTVELTNLEARLNSEMAEITVLKADAINAVAEAKATAKAQILASLGG